MTPQRVLINGETRVTLLSNGQEGCCVSAKEYRRLILEAIEDMEFGHNL